MIRIVHKRYDCLSQLPPKVSTLVCLTSRNHATLSTIEKNAEKCPDECRHRLRNANANQITLSNSSNFTQKESHSPCHSAIISFFVKDYSSMNLWFG
jgi:hypothetical protein